MTACVVVIGGLTLELASIIEVHVTSTSNVKGLDVRIWNLPRDPENVFLV